MFHASNIDLNIGDYLIPSPRNGRLYGTMEEYQCLVFGRNRDSLRDLGSNISTLALNNGKLGLKYIEHFPNIFNEEFKNKTAFIYEVENDGFVQGSWKVEYYRTEKAKIIGKRKVNLYDEIMKNVNLGNIEVDFYTETREYIEFVINHLLMVMLRGYEVEYIIELAKSHGVRVIEDYFRGLKKLNTSILEKLPTAKKEEEKSIND